MNKLTVAPYIFFQGNCREAMEFYQKALGGELKLLTNGELGIEVGPTDEAHIQYAELISGGIVLKGLDSKIANPEARKVELMISGSKKDEERLKQIFSALAEGGKVKHHMVKEARGNIEGRLYDASYGLDWIVSVEQ